MAPPDLVTKRLRLRKPEARDVDGLTALLNDWQLARWLPTVPHPYRSTDAEAYVARVAKGEFGATWVIEDDAGLCGGVSTDGSLGYWIAPRAWRKGYGTEAAEAVLALHFADPGAGPMAANYILGNGPSAGLLSKLGFGALPGRVIRRRSDTGAEVTLTQLILTPEQYHAMRPWVMETPRLRLRPLSHDDAPDIARIGGHPEVAPMIFAARVPWPEADASRLIEAQRWRGKLGFRLAITARAKGQLLGSVGVGPNGDVFYFLDPEVWGKGLVTEALRALLPAVMDRFGLDGLQADAFCDNPASHAVLEKLGFARTGTGLGHSAARLEPAPVFVYRLARSDLEARTP